jgi:hypothetical protein
VYTFPFSTLEFSQLHERVLSENYFAPPFAQGLHFVYDKQQNKNKNYRNNNNKQRQKTILTNYIRQRPQKRCCDKRPVTS